MESVLIVSQLFHITIFTSKVYFKNGVRGENNI